ncbi:MAG: hypothetical protein WBG57_10615 [Ornithinimicrobium sp.]
MTGLVAPLAVLALTALVFVQRWKLPANVARRDAATRAAMERTMVSPAQMWSAVAAGVVLLSYAVFARENALAAALWVTSAAVCFGLAALVQRQRSQVQGIKSTDAVDSSVGGDGAQQHRRRRSYPARVFGIPGFALMVAPQFIRGFISDPPPFISVVTIAMVFIGLLLLCIAAWIALQDRTAREERDYRQRRDGR